MKKTVTFELFGANQYLMFDISRLAEFEKVSGSSILALTAKDDYGFNFALDALPIAMKQHYKRTREEWEAVVTEFIENGGSLPDITGPLVMAMWYSGLMGKNLQRVADSIINKKEYVPEEVPEEEKNAVSPSEVSQNG